MTERQRQILEELERLSGWVYSADLALRVSCSERTIRTELKTLAESPGVEIESIRGKGVKLVSWERVESVSTEIDHEERVQRMTIDVLLAPELDNEDLIERYYISESTLRNDLAIIDEKIKKYQLTLKRRPLRISGEDRLRRAALTEALKDQQLTDWFAAEDIRTVEQAVDQLESISSQSFADIAYNVLTRQLLIQLKRIRLGGIVALTEQGDKIAAESAGFPEVLKVAELYRNQLAIKLPAREIKYLLLCFAGARETVMETQDLFFETLKPGLHTFASEVMTTIYGGTVTKELFDGLLLHVRSFAYQSLLGQIPFNPLLDQIKRRYAPTYAVVLRHAPMLEEALGLHLPESELGYLTLHFQTVLERRLRADKPRVLIACSYGVGMSRLLAAKIERQFVSRIEVIGTCKVRELNERINNEKPDAIISTVSIPNVQIPQIIVTPLLNDDDTQKIRQTLAIDGQKPYAMLSMLIHSVIFENEQLSRERALAKLIVSAEVDVAYAKTVYEREEAGTTAVGALIAIPHGEPEKTTKNQIDVLVLKQPTDWGGEKVILVLLLQFRSQDDVVLRQLFEDISRLSETPELVKQLAQINTEKEFRALLHSQ